MTRNDWIENVLKPWKEGEIVQYKKIGTDDEWSEYGISPNPDPLYASRFDLSYYEYRLKPHTVKYVFEFPEPEVKQGQFENMARALEYQAIYSGFADAIRNAKPMEEKDDK